MPKNQEPMIVLTLDQANVALACALNDIANSENYGDMPDFKDVGLMTFYMQRAELVQRLKTLLKAGGEVV